MDTSTPTVAHAPLPTIAPTIAIVGSGPSGCYLAQFSRKRWPDAEIVVFERLPLPYGLVRYGVAPDHPGTKAVTKQFDRLFEREGVRFVGGVEVGTDLTLAELRAAFDVVVLASGLSADRLLSSPGSATDGSASEGPDAPVPLPGAHLSGVYGAGRLTRLINGHPEETATGLSLGSRIVIVGHGNVAIDLLRLVLTAPEQLRELGVAAEVIAMIEAGAVRRIDVVGRSRPARAKFDATMVRELAKIPNVRFFADGLEAATDAAESPADTAINEASGAAKQQAIAALIAATGPLTEPSGGRDSAARTVHFHFGWSPVRITGIDAVASIVFDAGSGHAGGSRPELELPTQTIFTAIGFAEQREAPLRRDAHLTAASDLSRGLIDDGLYCVGWLRRGPQGTIPANRIDARMVTNVIAAAIESGALATGKPGYRVIHRVEPRIAV